MGADAAANMNNELRVQLVKIPKQVTDQTYLPACLSFPCPGIQTSRCLVLAEM